MISSVHDIEIPSRENVFPAKGLQYLGSVVFMILTFFELRLFLPKAQILKLVAVAKEKNRQAIWREYYSGKRVDLFHRGYAVVNKFVDASKNPSQRN